jgi:hypothetical protein
MVTEYSRQRADAIGLGRTRRLDAGKPDLTSIVETKAAAIDDLGDMASTQIRQRARRRTRRRRRTQSDQAEHQHARAHSRNASGEKRENHRGMFARFVHSA